MTIHQPKGAGPYKGTTVGVEQSKAQISKLLREYGAEAVQWTDNFQTGQVGLRFMVSREDGKAIGFDIKPAPFMEKHSSYDPMSGRNKEVSAPNWPRAMRLLLNWVKVKLESVAYGLTSIEEEFMANRVVRDATGRETTVGELVLPAIEDGRGQLMLEPPKTRDRASTIDAEARPYSP